MGISFTIQNSKGGVSKSSSTAAVCYELGKEYKVLAVDCDPQANLTAMLGIEPSSLDYNDTLAALMTDIISFKDTDVKKHIIETEFNVDLLPTSRAMRGIDKSLEQRDMRKEYVLKEIIDAVKNNYDFIFLDSGPTFSLLTINILVACDKVIIPLDLSEPATRGMLDLIDSMQRINKYFNPSLQLDGVFFARVKKGTVHSTETMVALQHALEKNSIYVYNTFIPDSIKIFEAISNKEPIGHYDPKCTTAIAYKLFTEELLGRYNG